MTVPYIFANAVGLVPASQLDVNFAYVSNNVSTADTVVANAQPNITSVGILTSLSTSGNIRGGNLLTAGTISATGTITTAGNLSLTGNIVDLGELWINTVSNGNINLNVNGTGNVNIPTGILGVTGNIQGGNLRTAGLISATANITGGNLLTAGLISATSNITGGNLLTAGLISATANITGGNVLTGGLISATADITGGNLLTAGLISATSTITSVANIIGGNVLTGGLISATANIIGGNVLTGGLISATANIIGGNLSGTNIEGTLTTASQTNIISVGTLDSLSATGNIRTSSNVIATGNVIAGNVRTVGLISATGNVTGNYFIGNGSQLTGLGTTYGNANVVANLAALGSNPVSTTGNVTGAYILGNGSALTSLPAPAVTQDITSNGAMSIMTYDGTIKYVNYATVEPSSGNIAGGNISATGNISGNYVLGNGSQLTGLPAQYGNANVTALLGNLGSNVISGTGNIVSNNITIIGTTQTINARETLTLAAGGQFNICTILTGGSGYDTGSALKATTGGSGSGMTVGIGYGLSNQLTNADVVDPGTGYVDGDVITVSGGTGGTFVITRYNDQANQGNNNFIESNWTFGNAGNLTLPGNTFAVNYANGTPVSIGGGGNTGNVTFTDQIVIGTGTNDGGGGLYLAPGNASIANSAVQYLRVRGGDYPTHIHLDTGNNQYFDQYFGADSKFVKLEANGNVVINADDSGANSASWIFGANGNLTAPGNISVTGNITAGNVSTGVITLTNGAVIKDTAGDSVSFGQNAGNASQGSEAVAIGLNAGANSQAAGAVAVGVGAGQLGQSITGIAIGDSAGYNTQGPGAVAIGAAAGFDSQGQYSVAMGYYAGNTNQANNSIIINATGAVLDQTTANTFTVAPVRNDVANIGNVMFYNATSKEITYGNVISVAGNITGSNLVTAGQVSATGNIITANSFVGNLVGTTVSVTGNVTVGGNLSVTGNVIGNVATRFESAWTVPVGNSTQSFTVSPNETYYLWVDCNITNGILTWNATATVTNTNVPVVGAQYAWVYSGGGTPIDFTSIPNQFVGTANTIVRSSVSPSATTNRFDFGINNTSGNSQTVRYGWIAIS